MAAAEGAQGHADRGRIVASKIWPAFFCEPEYGREEVELEKRLREEFEEAQDNAAQTRADLFEEGSPA